MCIIPHKDLGLYFCIKSNLIFIDQQGERIMKKEKSVPRYVTFLLIGLAAASLVFGIQRGETKTVHRKAANICMECIGIG